MGWEDKELLRLAVVGSVDDGKSTLIGRLLYETGSLFDDQIAAVKRASKQNGVDLDFSLFTDGLKAEREQAITIDVAYRYFSTSKRKFIIVDTPGHVQYTRNMATGASRADAAVVLVDARYGLQQQTRRHAYLLRLLGIDRLAVAINKMDLVQFDRARFEAIKRDFTVFAEPLRFLRVDFFPIAAAGGDNVCAASEKTPWNEAGTILEYLEKVPAGSGSADQPLRFPVQLVLRPHLDYRGFAGQLVAGTVKPGDDVLVLPAGRKARVKAVDSYEGELKEAVAPQSVTVRLTEEVDCSRGDVLVSVNEPATVARELEAHLVWMADAPLQVGKPYLVKQGTRITPAKVKALHGRVDLETLDEVPAQGLSANDIGRVSIECSRALVVDPYVKVRATGAFIVIDPLSNATVAAGMVKSAVKSTGDVGAVTADERFTRLGHRGAVVRVGTAEAATRLERQLFDAGIVAAVVGSRDLATALEAAGVVGIVADGSAAPDVDGLIKSLRSG
ncbi:MAG: 50S ribosome-binding GTPase [Archangiaceae bacterium]|nr:50S ribosome-binding GTPase [Archangiaceae bacterium]